MLKRRRAAIGDGVEPVFPDSLGGWRDPSNVRRVWREVRDDAEMEGLVSHTLRKTVASFLDDANVSTRKISNQLGHAKVSMTQDRYLGRRLTDRQTSDVLDDMFEDPADEPEEDPEEDPSEGKSPHSSPGGPQALIYYLINGLTCLLVGPGGSNPEPAVSTASVSVWRCVVANFVVGQQF